MRKGENKRESPVALGEFNATTGTDKDGCESCVGPHDTGSSDESSSIPFDFSGSRTLRIAESWLQMPDLHCCTWCSDGGGARKEIIMYS